MRGKVWVQTTRMTCSCSRNGTDIDADDGHDGSDALEAAGDPDDISQWNMLKTNLVMMVVMMKTNKNNDDGY